MAENEAEAKVQETTEETVKDNTGLDNLKVLENIAKKTGASISDTIILAGNVGLEKALKKGGSTKRKDMGIKTSVKSGNFRATKKGAGMTEKGVKAYRKANPGSKLKTAVTEKKPSKANAKRRKSYCARSEGQMKKFPKAAKDPNSRLRQARKRWRCR